MEIRDSGKRQARDTFFSLSTGKKRRRIAANSRGFFILKPLDDPLLCSTSTTNNYPCTSIFLRSDSLFTIGRSKRYCDFVFKDRRVSKRHCQIFFDSFDCKILILDGFISPPTSSALSEIRRLFRSRTQQQCKAATQESLIRASTNGVFVNGFRLGGGEVMELSVGDEVSLVCGNKLDPTFGIKIGFSVERFVCTEEVLGCNEIAFGRRWLMGEPKTIAGSSEEGPKEVLGKQKILASRGNEGINMDYRICRSSEYEDLIARAVSLLNQCRETLQSVDPIHYIRGLMTLNNKGKQTTRIENRWSHKNRENKFVDPLQSNNIVEIPFSSKLLIENDKTSCGQEPHPLCNLDAKWDLVNGSSATIIKENSVIHHRETVLHSEVIPFPASVCAPNDHVCPEDCTGTSVKDAVGDCKTKGLTFNSIEEVLQDSSDLSSKRAMNTLCSSAGKKFYLNRLEFVDHNLFNQHAVVSLPELLYPVASLSRIFIATFTSDVLWFLSYCDVPNHLPVTIACHNTDRCWSADPDKRISTPYLDFPNLVLVYPPFPDVVAFGKDRKKQGVACHHPKLLVLQREDRIRVVVTSANLVSKQWNSVTNTVWWQDFPRRSDPDYLSLFTHLTDGEAFEGFKSDFAAQLAGFMASLIADVPSQAHWITELTKYDFGGAVGHLVASVPGMHRQNNPYPLESMNFLSAKHCPSQSIGMKFLGSVEASVVGLKHRFHTAADSNGAQLKTLAAFLGKCQENAFGMSEAVLRRNTNIPADANAVSVLICDLDEFSEGDYIQLGFLPRNIANWVAPLCDAGFFRFSACIYPKEVLAAALEGSNRKVQLILYVSQACVYLNQMQGPKFFEISSLIKPEHVAAICSLVASVQRCSGIWRLKEVLGQYKWPELLETDFIYGSSSIGTSVDPKFLAAFSAAAGKRSLQFCDSEESDPEWGLWNASEELRNPSMRILFPTIERVKAAPCGVWSSRRVLCFSEKTWQRLRTVDILHDAIPHPSCRVGYPMHVKVARRRFQSKTGKSSFGWVYCGSHNFSPAAWGRPVSTTGEKTDGFVGTTSSLGWRLHVCNYELGIIFVVPPSDTTPKGTTSKCSNLDDIVLPFVVPAPKYRRSDRPATAQAMREALVELAELEKDFLEEAEAVGEMMEEEIPEEEEVVEVSEYVQEEKDEEKAYAETLWSQVDSSEG
ncbi:Forkhead-associated (FHA) domain [Macleaya cordata]|uniref:Forkhead-associated (FHA) domain n=1 Tax=Macleaya cordata TaxID=56857 RepID=A0A200PXW8_MACCD|nr:Forkhead-associated (FHA) domain [Macleaya cordata]